MSQGIEFNRLMLDMRSMQMDAMSAPKSTAAIPELGGSSFSDMLGQAINKVNDTQQASTQLASAFEIGKSGVDLTDVMISCLLYTSPSPRDRQKSRMPSSA